MRKAVNADDAFAVGPYSQGIDSGGFIYLSGQTPIDPLTGALRTGSIQDQTEQCFENLFAVLKAARLSATDVISVRVYLTDMTDFAAMNEVYERQFERPYPARTTIGVASLPLNAAIEIDLIARQSD